ncbi:MAG: hypothetical protein P4K86_10965 [Terracidiphilus sp.]|nr:hypothetical protein [Terracidiphilus sp.]
MGIYRRFGPLPLFAMAVALGMTGCPQSQDQVAASANQAGGQAQNSDPANANLAPADGSSGAQAPAASNTQQSAPAVQRNYAQPTYATGNNYQSNRQYAQDSDYGAQPVYYSSEAPPPLPQYRQPEAPGDGYLWTPGYWGWSSRGYYWVPGAWVEAPYEGALWTPGYWGYRDNRYRFYRGYWGRHVGFYGGVDYGFGYIGFGYRGGYWNGGHFNYNRSVNNVNVSIVRNVYNYNVPEQGGNRVSFNGGSGGVQMRARPEELAAQREQHSAPMRGQLQNERLASTNRAQFANVNHGQPASVVANRPLAADRNVRVPAALPTRNMGGQQQQQQRQAVQQQQQHQAAQQQRQAAPQQQQRQAAPQQQQRQAAPQQQQRQAAPQQKQEEHKK